MKQQRNDKCACGSGKKAKKCCLLAEMIENAARVKGFRAAKQLRAIEEIMRDEIRKMKPLCVGATDEL